MRASVISVVLASLTGISASVIHAREENPHLFPYCYANCLGLYPRGSCSLTDNNCLCNNQGYIDATTACVVDMCADATEAQKGFDYAATLCQNAGVTL